MRAAMIIPERPPYPTAAIRAGLAAVGVEIVPQAAPHEAVITWSPWVESLRAVAAASGHVVIVIENGGLTPIDNTPYYQLALWGWNGTGVSSPVGDLDDRLDRWLRVQGDIPKRDNKGPVLVVGQAGSSTDRRTAPRDWMAAASAALRGQGISVKERPKPVGPISPHVVQDLAHAMEGCSSVVSWSSNALTWAVLWDFPTAFAGPSCAVWAVSKRWSSLSDPYRPSRPSALARRQTFRHLAGAQWSTDEIATGVPFKTLLSL